MMAAAGVSCASTRPDDRIELPAQASYRLERSVAPSVLSGAGNQGGSESASGGRSIPDLLSPTSSRDGLHGPSGAIGDVALAEMRSRQERVDDVAHGTAA